MAIVEFILIILAIGILIGFSLFFTMYYEPKKSKLKGTNINNERKVPK
jgi:hypothetical protein